VSPRSPLPPHLKPANWPVRWRLAATSAGLTLAILLIFGGVIGSVATDRIRDDFNREIDGAAQTLAGELRIVNTPTGSLLIRGPGLDDFALPNDATVRVFDAAGTLLTQSTDATRLGPPREGSTEVNGLRVATAPISSESGAFTGYVQYGRGIEHLDSTVDRLWLFVALGILGGTVLASLAGAAIANRAMRPISSLTATARKIADTGDPSSHMPDPVVDDEVGELTITLEQMLRPLRQQREFVADASHELRTPLTSVIANLELLQASLEGPDHEEERAMVASALRSSSRMSRLVSDLLLLARADAGRIGARTRCDIADVAGNAAAEVAPTIGERALRLDNRVPLPVDGNPDELHRLVVNLLDNAVRHTPPGSAIELRLYSEGRHAVVEVADDGPGVPPEQRERIFDRFVRGDGSADTATRGGSGLGLAIVKAVATSHGGNAEVTDSDRGGATFRVRVPLARPKMPPDRGSPNDSRAGGVGNGVLARSLRGRGAPSPRQDPPAKNV
jgi:two-component system, OmpR family, sensor kinase